MKNKRPKLRLRKQVLITLPILLLLLIASLGFMINKNKKFATEVLPNNQKSSKQIEESSWKLSDISYIQDFSDMVNDRQKDNTIIYYASNFKLNIERTLEIAHNLTNDFTDEQYLKTYIIAPSKLAKTIKPFKSFEAGVVYFVRDLYRYPERYGSSISEIRLDETPTITRNIIDGKIYMDNGLTFEQYLGKICDLYDLDKSIVLAIVHEETGVMTSALFNYSNNIGGLRGIGGWMNFTTLEAGIIAHVISIKYFVDNYNIDLSSPDAVAKLSGVYVKGNVNSYSESWTNKVNHFRENINKQDLFTYKQ